MQTTILVAGATGDLGGRIIHALLGHGAKVRALVRAQSDKAKIETLEKQGAELIRVSDWNVSELTVACKDSACVVSALQGLRDVIVVGQSILLDAAIAAGVPRFIPSDFSSDLTQETPGENRNFDLRHEFHQYLDKSPIKATSILNGAFAELLKYNIPFLNFKNQTVGYWGSADWRVDFTTKDNTAEYTAVAALDPSTPRILRIAGIQVSANEMAALTGELLHHEFKPVRLGSLEELSTYNKRERAAHPEGEREVFPFWQQSQYAHSMFSTQLQPLDNDRYAGIKWTGIKEILAG